MQQTKHLSPDGGIITVDGDGSFDLGRTWFGYIQFRPATGGRAVDEAPFGINTGPRASVELGVRSIDGALRTEQRVRRGTVVVHDGFDDGRPVSLSAWVGSSYAAWAFHYPPDDTIESISALYDKLDLTEQAHGLRVSADSTYEAYGVRSYKQIPGVGMLSVHPGTDAGQLVPRWSGSPTSAGELWRQPTAVATWSDTFVLATPTAVATILPNEATGSADERHNTATRFAESISRLSWDG